MKMVNYVILTVLYLSHSVHAQLALVPEQQAATGGTGRIIHTEALKSYGLSKSGSNMEATITANILESFANAEKENPAVDFAKATSINVGDNDSNQQDNNHEESRRLLKDKEAPRKAPSDGPKAPTNVKDTKGRTRKLKKKEDTKGPAASGTKDKKGRTLKKKENKKETRASPTGPKSDGRVRNLKKKEEAKGSTGQKAPSTPKGKGGRTRGLTENQEVAY